MKYIEKEDITRAGWSLTQQDNTEHAFNMLDHTAVVPGWDYYYYLYWDSLDNSVYIENTEGDTLFDGWVETAKEFGNLMSMLGLSDDNGRVSKSQY